MDGEKYYRIRDGYMQGIGKKCLMQTFMVSGRLVDEVIKDCHHRPVNDDHKTRAQLVADSAELMRIRHLLDDNQLGNKNDSVFARLFEVLNVMEMNPNNLLAVVVMDTSITTRKALAKKIGISKGKLSALIDLKPEVLGQMNRNRIYNKTVTYKDILDKVHAKAVREDITPTRAARELGYSQSRYNQVKMAYRDLTE